MPKSPPQDIPASQELAFEDALSRLEELVQDMESDQMPLEELIKNYEQGTRLYQICEKRLDEARGRIEIIRKKRNQEHVLETFGEDAGDHDADEVIESEVPENDGELF